MRLVDMLPESFVESDFVTNQRLKYEASKKRRVIVDAIAIGTGIVIGATIAISTQKSPALSRLAFVGSTLALAVGSYRLGQIDGLKKCSHKIHGL